MAIDNGRGDKNPAVGLDPKTIVARDFPHAMSKAQIDPRGAALRQQHREDLACRSIAEQLPQRLLVIGNTMTLDHRDKVAGRITTQRGLAEVRVRREIAFRQVSFAIGKVAAAATRNEDFRAGRFRVFKQQHSAAAAARLNRTHQPGRTGADNNRIKGFHRSAC